MNDGVTPGTWILLFIVFAPLLYLAFFRDIWASFGHGHWAENATPDINATIVGMMSSPVQYTKNNAKYCTVVRFSDGYVYESHKTNRDNGFMNYTISVDGALRAEIAREAIAKHKKAVMKRLKEDTASVTSEK